MLENSIFAFLKPILKSLNDDDEKEDRKRIYQCLGLVENLLDLGGSAAAQKFLHDDELVAWLSEFFTSVDTNSENFLFSCEITASLITQAPQEFQQKFAVTQNGIDSIFQVFYQYLEGKVIESEEELEALTNLFDTLSFLMDSEDIETKKLSQQKVNELEGYQIFLAFILKQKLLRRHCLANLASFTDGNKEGSQAIVDQDGLSVIFPVFMSVSLPPKKPKKKEQVFVKLSTEDI